MILATMKTQLLVADGFDLHGQRRFKPGKTLKVAPVKVEIRSQHTTVRTDSSGTHGAAGEQTADVVVLASPKTRVTLDDVLVVHGNRLRIEVIKPRFDAGGRHDHNEIHCVQA